MNYLNLIWDNPTNFTPPPINEIPEHKTINGESILGDGNIVVATTADTIPTLKLILGSEKPNNFEEIYDILREICVEHKFYNVKIFDTITKSYLGDSEVIYNPNSGNNFVIKQLSISGDNTISIRQYSFNANGTYERKAIAWGGGN